MSSFKITARYKKTGEVKEVWCLDDYFGRHRYGYVIDKEDVLTEEQFYRLYEPTPPAKES